MTSIVNKSGNDDINGNQGQDTMYGGDGGDSVRGGQGNDIVYGDAGDDPHVNGNLGNDFAQSCLALEIAFSSTVLRTTEQVLGRVHSSIIN